MKNRSIGPIVCVILVLALLIAGVILVLQQTKATFEGGTTRPAESTFAGEPADTSNLPTVYTSDFANGDARGWTSRLTDRTPNNQPFLGQFNNELVSLKVSQLPEHLMLRVSFDLYVINTWDGSGVISAAGGRSGPDYFLVGLEGGPTLLCATFSNLPDTGNFAEDGKRQTYPAPIPSQPVMGGTGSTGVHSLGYVFTYNPPGVSFPQDSAYRVSFVFPHTDEAVQLNFIGMGLQSIRDEGWGVANVKIELATPGEAPAESQLATWWEQVIGNNPIAARDAFWQMVEAREATVAFLEKQNIGSGLDREKTEAMIAKLSIIDPDPTIVQALADLGPVIEPLLHEARRKAPTLAQTLDEVRAEIEVRPLDGPSGRKAAAAARLLEIIGSPEAARVQTLLAGRPDPATQSGTPEHAADWKRRFDVAYNLRTNENVRYIPRPFPPERSLFLQERRTRLEQQRLKNPDAPVNEVSLSDEFSWVTYATGRLTTDQQIVQFDSSGASNDEGAKGLRRTLKMLHIYADRSRYGRLKTEIPPALDDLELTGDWLIRPRLNQQKALDDLTRIIAEQTGRRIRFTKAQDTEQIVVVRGAYRLMPEPGAPENTLQIYAGEKPLGKVHPTDTQFADVLANLDFIVGMPFRDESGSSQTPLRWYIDRPSIYHARRAASRLPDEAMDALLARMASQTGLTFTREERPTQKLVAVEEK